MAHQAQFDFVKRVKARFPDHFKTGRVLDVGSAYINGTNRWHFSYCCEYLGLDLGPGPGVDLVAHCADFRQSGWDGGLFDVVISTEALEHDSRWEETFRAMYDMTRPGGLMVMTCAGDGREEHGTTRTTPGNSPHTTDYYRNLDPEDFKPLLKGMKFEQKEWSGEGHPVCDTYFWGIKK
jgi:SAM-dependent methyltransferase